MEVIELVMEIEDTFGITLLTDDYEIDTVGDLYKLVTDNEKSGRASGETWEMLRAIIVEVLCVAPEQVTLNARIHDLTAR